MVIGPSGNLSALSVFGCVCLTCDTHVIVVEGVGKTVTEDAVGQRHLPHLDSYPQMNQVRSLKTRNTNGFGIVTSPLLRTPLKTTQWLLSLDLDPPVTLLPSSGPSSSPPRVWGLKTPGISRLLYPVYS